MFEDISLNDVVGFVALALVVGSLVGINIAAWVLVQVFDKIRRAQADQAASLGLLYERSGGIFQLLDTAVGILNNRL